MRYLRLAVSLLLCASAVPVLALSARGMVMFPRALSEPSRSLGLAGMAPGDLASLVLLYPLICMLGVANGLLLGWSGVRGLFAVKDPARWRRRQRPGLAGLLLAGTASLASGVAAPPDSREIVALPASLEAIAYLFAVFFSLTGLLSMLCMLLDEPVEAPRPRRGQGAAVRRTEPKAVRRRRLETPHGLAGKM